MAQFRSPTASMTCCSRWARLVLGQPSSQGTMNTFRTSPSSSPEPTDATTTKCSMISPPARPNASVSTCRQLSGLENVNPVGSVILPACHGEVIIDGHRSPQQRNGHRSHPRDGVAAELHRCPPVAAGCERRPVGRHPGLLGPHTAYPGPADLRDPLRVGGLPPPVPAVPAAA